MLTRRASDIANKLFRGAILLPGFSPHHHILRGYDEPKILLSSTNQICPASLETEHIMALLIGFPQISLFLPNSMY